ncbi:MAG: peptidylprolyl isomerase [Acidimicrobiia bacterium]
MKRTLSLLLLVAVALLAACSDSSSSAASVNGHDISTDEVLHGVKGFAQSKLFVQQLAQQGVTLDPKKPSVPSNFTAQWLTSLIQEKAIEELAKQRGVRASDREVAQAESQFKTGQSAQVFAQLPAYLRKEIIATTALQGALRSSLKPTTSTKQLDQAYQQLSADCASKKLVGHILVATEQEAQQVVDQLKKGDTFANVANQVSTDTGSKAQGGLLMCEGSAQWPQLDATFRSAAEATPVGQISKPVQTQFGFHVIEALPLTPENAQPLVAATAQQVDPLESVVTKFLAKAKIWVNPRFGKLTRSGSSFQITPPVSTAKSRPATSPSTSASSSQSGSGQSSSGSQSSSATSSTTAPTSASTVTPTSSP